MKQQLVRGQPTSVLEQIVLPSSQGEPPYKSLARCIRESIAAGQLRPGDLLPTRREIAARFHVSTLTVGRAYNLLLRDRVIEGGRRKRVAGRPAEEAAGARRLRLRGRVRAIQTTPVGAQVVVELADAQQVSVATSWTAVEWLGLGPGQEAELTIDVAGVALAEPTSGEAHAG